MNSFDEDYRWQEKFGPHYVEIARKAVLRDDDLSLTVDEFKRNTDRMLTAVVRLPNGQLRISARARRHKYKKRYLTEFTVRCRRPSGFDTEMQKLLEGYGDVFVYGFEAELNADRLHPWFIGNSEMLRQYIRSGGYYEIRPNVDHSSHLAAFDLSDMPIGFLIDSEGHIPSPYKAGWVKCRNSYDPDVGRGGKYRVFDNPLGNPWRGQRVGMCDGDYGAPLAEPTPDGAAPEFESGLWRRCMCCGFEWKSGWVMGA